MKTIQLFIIALAISFSAKSQDFIYEGPARAEVRSFWTNAMGIQKTQKFAEGVAVLEAKIKGVKEKDPAYKTDKMEAEIAKWKAKIGGSNGTEQPQEDFSKLNSTQKAIKADQLLRKLFFETVIDVSTSTLPVIQFKFDDYNKLVQQYISLNTKPNESDIKHTKLIIEKHVYATNSDITKLEAAKGQGTTPDAAEANYYLAKYNQLYWDAAVKIFPEEASYADQQKVITDFVNKNGSLEDLKAGMNKNKVEEIKNRKLPASSVKDAKLEKIVNDGFNNAYGAKAAALKVVLVQNGWTTLRNAVSGVVTGRERTAKLAYKAKDGKCYLLDDYIFIREEYIGSSFTNTKAVFNGLFGQEMLCENVK
jgi:hypothetical protein